MFKYFNNRRKKGQSTLEYAVLIIIILGALLAIQVYIKRGVQGRLKSATDDIGDQFSPGNTNVVKVSRTRSQTGETFASGATTSTLLANEVTDDIMNSTVMNIQQEFWGN
jgi:cytoskeletal protein RodZ